MTYTKTKRTLEQHKADYAQALRATADSLESVIAELWGLVHATGGDNTESLQYVLSATKWRQVQGQMGKMALDALKEIKESEAGNENK